MSRIDVFQAEFVPSDPRGIRYSDALIHRRADDELIGAIFSGPWFGLASKAFSSVVSSESGAGAFRAAIAAIDRQWHSLSEEDRCWDWGGTACGIMAEINPDMCSCSWLGDDQAHHVRGGSVIGSTSPHTLYHILKANGHKEVEENRRNYLIHWLSADHPCGRVTWKLQTGDVVLVCSRFVNERLIPAKFDTRSPLTLAETLVKKASEQVGRLSHHVLALRVSDDETIAWKLDQ